MTYANYVNAIFSNRAKATITAVVVVVLFLVLVIKPFSGVIKDNSLSFQNGYENAAHPVNLVRELEHDCENQWHAYEMQGSPFKQNNASEFQDGCQAYKDSH